MIYLETERLILRDYREDDFDEYFRLKTDEKTMYYLQDIQLFSKEEADEDFQMVLEDMKKLDRKFYFLHMELKESHEQVGSVGLLQTIRQRENWFMQGISHIPSSGEMGIQRRL